METIVTNRSHRMLAFNTVAFTVCFAAWMFNGVMVTFLVESAIFRWTSVQIGWLLGAPVLVGSVMRLPVGILTDKFGGRWVMTAIMILCAVAMYFLSLCCAHVFSISFKFIFFISVFESGLWNHWKFLCRRCCVHFCVVSEKQTRNSFGNICIG